MAPGPWGRQRVTPTRNVKSIPTGKPCSECPTREKSISWSLQLATHLQILSKAANPSVTTFTENHSLKEGRWAKIASGRPHQPYRQISTVAPGTSSKIACIACQRAENKPNSDCARSLPGLAHCPSSWWSGCMLTRTQPGGPCLYKQKAYHYLTMEIDLNN